MDQDKKSVHVEKFDIKLKAKPKDGVILQLHHTVKGSKGEYRRIRFTTGTFDDVNGKLACGDTAGNVFILDFIELKFWKLTQVGCSTALHFVPNKNETLIAAGALNYNLNFVNIESGNTTLCLSGHSAPVKHISFSNNAKVNNLLTASQVEAILWELRNYTKYFTLNTYLAAPIQQIMFSPSGEYLAACFQNDTLQIWRHENMKSVKQIIPSDLKHMKSFAFTMNGRAMAMAGLAPTIILFNMDTWTGVKSIDMCKYKIMGATQIAFIPQLFDGGANKILAILSSDNILTLFDVESLYIVHIIRPETSGIRKFLISPTGKYFLCILQLGEVNIYNSSYVIKPLNKKEVKSSKSNHSCPTMEHHESSIREIEQKMRVCMDSTRLRRILMEYGEYPDKFRSIIWRSLLDTPRNRSAYTALLEKGIHPAYKDIEKQFTIRSSVTLKNLKRLLSCLAHWSPLFCVMKFLPGFVFPFVKVLQKDPLLLFECVATILFNYCQLWFEYAPFPPISILAVIENILSQHDQQLLSFFRKMGITSQTYALKILETAFSEVLTCSEWLILWDHILSNEPGFILMAVVSYNIVERNILRKLKTPQEIEKFFHMQNPIDKKFFIKNSYSMLNKTSSDIHPKRFLKPFAPFDKGNSYPPFTGYPKATICLKLAKTIRRNNSNTDMDTFQDKALRNLEIEARVHSKTNKGSDSKLSESDDYDSLEDYTAEKCRMPSNSHQRVDNKVETVKKDTKEELIQSIIYPTNIQLNRHKKVGLHSTTKRDKEASKHVKSKSKKKSVEKKNGSSEKRVEKLIRSNSDVSES